MHIAIFTFPFPAAASYVILVHRVADNSRDESTRVKTISSMWYIHTLPVCSTSAGHTENANARNKHKRNTRGNYVVATPILWGGVTNVDRLWTNVWNSPALKYFHYYNRCNYYTIIVHRTLAFSLQKGDIKLSCKVCANIQYWKLTYRSAVSVC